MPQIKGNTLTAAANGASADFIRLLAGTQTIFLTVPIGTVTLEVSPISKLKWSTLKNRVEVSPSTLTFAAGEHNLFIPSGNMFLRLNLSTFSGVTPVEVIVTAS